MIFGTAYAIAVTLYTVPIQGHPHPAPPQQFCTDHPGQPRQCVQIAPDGTLVPMPEGVR